jgi:hypothetical protein
MMGYIYWVLMDEKEAIHRLKQGDIHGLEFLVNQFQLKAVRVAYLITRDLGMAEDIVQESFVKVYRSIQTFEENRPFEPCSCGMWSTPPSRQCNGRRGRLKWGVM